MDRIGENMPGTGVKNADAALAALIGGLQTGVLWEDTSGKVVMVNKAFCEIFLPASDPLDMTGAYTAGTDLHCSRYFAHDGNWLARVQQLRKEAAPIEGELLPLIDGRILRRGLTPVVSSGICTGYIWKYDDVTLVTKYQKTLKMQDEKYYNIIANMNLGLMETNRQGIIQSVNDNFCVISGYDKDELIGRTALEILLSEGNRHILEEKASLNKYGIIDIFQIPLINKNGEERWWMISDAPVYDDNGALKGMIGIHLDISDQKRMEKELEVAKVKAEESSNAKEMFLANMSHEIRTPLNAIIGMVRELLKEDLGTKHHTYLNNAAISAQHLLSLINNILDISKIGAGEFQLETRHFNLRTVIEETVNIVSMNAREKLLALEVNIPHDIPAAFIGDPTRIRQILINLAGNAIKFTEKGKVSINCNMPHYGIDAGEVMLSIVDTGIGIDREYLKSLFNKFTQEDKSTARKYGGTGLGMAITYELIQLMGGRIEVESEKGAGTRIDVYLPLHKGRESSIEQELGTKELDRLNDIRVLLVEDNVMNRLVAKNTLSLFDMHITEAENGFEAIEKIKAQPFDIILMDLQMPVMDGISATRTIRDTLKINTPIIALTANAFTKEIDMCLAAGMNDYITKPFEEDTLLGTIARNLGKHINFLPLSKPRVKHNAAGEKLYDLGKVREISRGNTDFVKKMVRMFIQEIPLAARQIKDAAETGDIEMVSRIAHRIKPSITNMQINSILKDVQQLETAALHQENVNDLLPLIQNIENILSLLIVQLSTEL